MQAPMIRRFCWISFLVLALVFEIVFYQVMYRMSRGNIFESVYVSLLAYIPVGQILLIPVFFLSFAWEFMVKRMARKKPPANVRMKMKLVKP